MIDPVHYARTLPFLFRQHELVVPFMTTGLGDLFIWHSCPGHDSGEGAIRQLQPRYGDLSMACSGDDYSLGEFWRVIQSVDGEAYEYKGGDQDMLDYATYYAGMEMGGGKPGINESLTHIPLNILNKGTGGDANLRVKDPSTLDRGDLCVALGMFGQVAGQADLLESIATTPWEWQADRGWGPFK